MSEGQAPSEPSPAGGRRGALLTADTAHPPGAGAWPRAEGAGLVLHQRPFTPVPAHFPSQQGSLWAPISWRGAMAHGPHPLPDLGPVGAQLGLGALNPTPWILCEPAHPSKSPANDSSLGSSLPSCLQGHKNPVPPPPPSPSPPHTHRSLEAPVSCWRSREPAQWTLREAGLHLGRLPASQTTCPSPAPALPSCASPCSPQSWPGCPSLLVSHLTPG